MSHSYNVRKRKIGEFKKKYGKDKWKAEFAKFVAKLKKKEENLER